MCAHQCDPEEGGCCDTPLLHSANPLGQWTRLTPGTPSRSIQSFQNMLERSRNANEPNLALGSHNEPVRRTQQLRSSLVIGSRTESKYRLIQYCLSFGPRTCVPPPRPSDSTSRNVTRAPGIPSQKRVPTLKNVHGTDKSRVTEAVSVPGA